MPSALIALAAALAAPPAAADAGCPGTAAAALAAIGSPAAKQNDEQDVFLPRGMRVLGRPVPWAVGEFDVYNGPRKLTKLFLPLGLKFDEDNVPSSLAASFNALYPPGDGRPCGGENNCNHYVRNAAPGMLESAEIKADPDSFFTDSNEALPQRVRRDNDDGTLAFLVCEYAT